MIRRIGRSTLKALRALVAAAQAKDGNTVTATYSTGKAPAFPSVVSFDYRSLNPHGCPWPGRVEARRRMGYTRRPK